MKFTYLKQPPKRYTFEMPKLKKWIEQNCKGKVLNLFAGKVLLKVDETRNDLDTSCPADYHMHADDILNFFIDRNIKFDTIIFDPPHAHSFKSIFFGIPDRETWLKNHPEDKRKYPSYYGMDIYKSHTQLLLAIHKAQNEFLRVLKDDGILWFNWSEIIIRLERILVLFKDSWDEHIRLQIASEHQTLSDCKNYWICLMKGNSPFKQTTIV